MSRAGLNFVFLSKAPDFANLTELSPFTMLKLRRDRKQLHLPEQLVRCTEKKWIFPISRKWAFKHLLHLILVMFGFKKTHLHGYILLSLQYHYMTAASAFCKQLWWALKSSSSEGVQFSWFSNVAGVHALVFFNPSLCDSWWALLFFFLIFWILFYLFFYTAGSYQLSILYILVYICQPQSPNSSPPTPCRCPPLVSIRLFSTSVSPFLPC